MDRLADMLANMFKSDALTFHRRLGVLRCFRPDNLTGIGPTTLLGPNQSQAVSDSSWYAWKQAALGCEVRLPTLQQPVYLVIATSQADKSCRRKLVFLMWKAE